MAMDLVNSLYIAASGMKAQSDRLRIVAQNVANANSTGETPGAAPYRRQVLTFRNRLDRELGIDRLEVSKYGYDKAELPKKYDPGHPAADADGYVLFPNVNSIIEMMDMREASKSYQANLQIIDISKHMLFQTIALLR